MHLLQFIQYFILYVHKCLFEIQCDVDISLWGIASASPTQHWVHGATFAENIECKYVTYGYCIWYFINYVCVMSSKPIVVFVWSGEFRTIINSSTWLAFYFIYIHKIALYVYSGDHSISTPLFVRIYLKQHIIFLTYLTICSLFNGWFVIVVFVLVLN